MHIFHSRSSSASSEARASHIQLGYPAELRRNRALAAVLSMALAITAVPYGMGSALTSAAVYGGGPLSLFVGLLVVLLLDGCVALSLAELASRFPTSSGVYYWSYRLLAPTAAAAAATAATDKKTTAETTSATKGISQAAVSLSYITGWFWLIGNWTITLSVNFGFASLIAATVAIYEPSWNASAWELLLVFFALCLVTFAICAAGDSLLPYVDTVAAAWNLLTILVVLICLAATAKTGRHSAGFALGHYDDSFSGWGRGFSFFIGLLPPAYTFCAIGMVTSMAEECEDPEVQVPRAMTLCMPLGGAAALLFVLPICFTLPPQADLLADAPYGQALPYILARVLGSRGGAVAVMALVLGVALFCSVSITTTASRCTWAFARDSGIPLSGVWARTVAGRPLPALALVTVIEMLLGLINLGSTSAFTAFVSVGVMGLAMGYLVPIAISLATRRREVALARWRLRPAVGVAVNVVALLWIAFELVLFSMPQTLPVTAASMNYASVVFVGFAVISATWYCISGRRGKFALFSGFWWDFFFKLTCTCRFQRPAR